MLMKKSKFLVSLLSIFVLVFGLALTGCSEKTEEEKTMEDAAKQAEKDAEKLKEEAEKKLGK